MALTRLGQITGELQDEIELIYTAGVKPVLSSTKAYTGTYSWRATLNTEGFGFSFPSTTQIKAHYYINHNGITSNLDPMIFRWTGSLGVDYIYWDGTDDLLKLNVNGVDVDTISAAAAGFSAIDTWYSVGISIYTDASAGFISLYIDGVEVLSYAGNTGTYLDTLVTAWRIGNFGGWDSYTYYDDFYCDDAVGEVNGAPEAKRFLFTTVNGSGNNDWTNDNGDSVNNYTYVDEVPNDGDTTYVEAGSATLKDDYDVVGITVPVGYKIDAVIPIAIARNSSAGPSVKLYTYDGATYQTSGDKVLTTNYAVVNERQPLQPNGLEWNETDVNAIKIGIESGGTY